MLQGEPSSGGHEAGEVLALQIARAARMSRDRIAERLELESDTAIAWLYRSTIA